MPVLRFAREGLLKSAAERVSEQLPVDEGEVRGRAHGGHVCLSFRCLHRRADQFAVRQVDAILLDGTLEALHVVGADLVAEPARTAVNLNGKAAGQQAEYRGGLRIEDLIDHIDFNEVVARAERADLLPPARLGPVGYLARIGPVDAALFLGAGKVALGGIAVALRPGRTIAQDALQLGDAHLKARLADAARAVAVEQGGKLIKLWLGLLELDARGQQPHAAIDIVANGAR